MGSELPLGDRDALVVRDYARAHPFEDVDAKAISGQAGNGNADGSPAVADSALASGTLPGSGGQSAVPQLGDSNMFHGEEASTTRGHKHETEHDVDGGVQKRSHVDDLHCSTVM